MEELEPNEALAYEFQQAGDNYIRAGDLDAGVLAYRRAIELDPDNPGGYYALGLALQRQNKLHEAIVEYRRTLNLNPNSAWSLYKLGEVYKLLEDPDEARRWWTELSRCDNQYMRNLAAESLATL